MESNYMQATASDQRESERVPMALSAELRIPGNEDVHEAQVIDMSHTGVRLAGAPNAIAPGTSLVITIPAIDDDTPPMTVQALVIRSMECPEGNGYAVACALD